ncbi:hypothetical protein A2U01_0089023, partial [Trifolium medium]|nr:hypothetical protein [Trifolium medium]
EEGVVELVELSKIPMIVGSKHFFGSTEKCTPGAEEGEMNLVGAMNLVGLPKILW